MESLSVKYRPHDWEDVCEQTSVIKILTQQIANETFKNAYIFSGASGCGKTTLSRIFADKINQKENSAIEIDAASNNGVDNIKALISVAQQRSIESKYKIIILDEAHMLTTQSWNALLKTIEEPPKYTIFIFCTTDPQKIPETILNRCQRFNFSKISTNKIIERLAYIAKNEGFVNYENSLDYIAKLSNGCMRDAISLLDKCSSYSNDISIENVLNALQSFSYNDFFELMNAIIDGDDGKVLTVIDNYYFNGYDMKLFVNNFMSFVLDLVKYITFKSFDLVSIPSAYQNKINEVVNISDAGAYYMKIVDRMLELKNMIKYDSDAKSTIEAVFLNMSRCI